MSETYDLICTTCKESLWIGQGHDQNFYIYTTPRQIELLNEFVNRHQTLSSYSEDKQHNLQIISSQDRDDGYMEDQRTYEHRHRTRWFFTRNHEKQELEEYEGSCTTEFYTYHHREMLHVVRDMVKNGWTLEYVVDVE